MKPADKDEASAHRKAIMLVLAHLSGYETMCTRSGMPPEAAFSLLRYNLRALLEWTPEQVDEALREVCR